MNQNFQVTISYCQKQIPSSSQVKLSTPSQPHPPPPPPQVTNESRRKKEDNLAAVFMGFIIVFLVCHLPRLLLNIHELATIR